VFTRPAILAAVLIPLAGCAVSREDQLRRTADRLESKLGAEQARVLALPPTDAERAARLDNLTGLRSTLSGAKISVGAVSGFVPEQYRGMAYDTIDEVFSTIDWNIPLGPGDQKRGLPNAFSASGLNYAAFGGATRPATPSGISPPVVPSAR
jgi:hypothetical protein